MINKLIKRAVLNRKGQTLIEVVVTMGVALIIITSIVALVNASNRRATIARQATQASKLAQEGMEIVRSIREGQDNVMTWSSSAGPCTTTGSPCNWNDLYTVAQGTQNACLFFDDTPPLPDEWQLRDDTPGNCVEETVGGSLGGPSGDGIFNRRVQISDVALSSGNICSNAGLLEDEIKRVSVRITWESPIGAQDREVISCLSNWR